MQISARCVLPVTSISRLRNRRSTSHGGTGCSAPVGLLERELELVQRVVPRFVDARRLARRADEHAREQIRERGMVLPIGDQAAQQVRPPQERTVGRARPAEHDVVAAACARMPAVEHELLGHEPRVMRVLVQTLGDREHLVPTAGRLHVDLDDAGVRRHLDHVQPRVARRLVTFEVNRQIELGARVLDGREQIEVVLELGHGRHEYAQMPVARLDGDGRARGTARRRPLRPSVLAPLPALSPCKNGCRSGCGSGSGSCSTNGSAGTMCGYCDGGRWISDCSGKRNPSGESPGTRNSLPARVVHRSLAQRRVGGGRRVPALHGQDVTDGLAQAPLEDARKPRARHRIVEAVRGRVEILGQLLFLADEMPRILVRRRGRFGVELQAQRHSFQELPRVLGGDAVVVRFLRNQLVRAPQILAVAPPIQAERPARQLLAGVPLTLAVVQQAARREARTQPVNQLRREPALGRARRGRIPFGRIGIVHRDERRLAADRDANIVGDQLLLDAAAECVDGAPLLLAVRLRHARRLDDALHAHQRARTSSRLPRAHP